MKLYTNKLDHVLFFVPAIVRELTQQNVEIVVLTEAQEKEMPDFKAKRAHGKMPMLELADGSMIFEHIAIAEYLARTSVFSGMLCGHSAFEEAQIAQWVGISAADNINHAVRIYTNTLGYAYNPEDYADAVKSMKEKVKQLNTHLAGKTFLVGQRLTLADIVTFAPLSLDFALVLDAGFRKAMPNVSEWFARVAAQSAVMNVAGACKMCEKPVKPIDWTKLPVVAAPIKSEKKEVVAEVAEEKADEDAFDPFADDEEEDEEAEKAKMARMKEIAKTAKSYGKAPVIAKSIILFEVKPWGEDTDLDALAKMILAIEMDGLFWKTEYKKEPIAYGVFKIIIGCVVEDDKVSTDLLQEAIEAFEDEVQSVDIQSFNKL
jgi:glutathione S-transferase/translation elongation factor EF-1beta